MKQTISTEQEVEKLLASLRQPGKSPIVKKMAKLTSIEKPKTVPVFRLNLVDQCIEVQRTALDNTIVETSSFLTPQETAQLAFLQHIDVLGSYGKQKALTVDEFQISHNGFVMLAKGAVYKWQYGLYCEYPAKKIVRGHIVLYKTELYKQTYLFAQNLENGKISYLGYKYITVNKNCFKIWLNGEWNAYFINHTTCSKICSGKEIIPMGKDKFRCVDSAGKSELWEFKKRSPQRYVSAKLNKRCL